VTRSAASFPSCIHMLRSQTTRAPWPATTTEYRSHSGHHAVAIALTINSVTSLTASTQPFPPRILSRTTSPHFQRRSLAVVESSARDVVDSVPPGGADVSLDGAPRVWRDCRGFHGSRAPPPALTNCTLPAPCLRGWSLRHSEGTWNSPAQIPCAHQAAVDYHNLCNRKNRTIVNSNI
jgi:hypothetical protein